MKNRLGSAKTALTRYALLWALCLAAGWILYAYAQLPLDSSGRRTLMSLVLTPDQQGQRYLKQQAYEQALKAYTNPVLKGVALFRTTYLFNNRDDREWETDVYGFGRTFPHEFKERESKTFTTFLTLSPAGDEILLDFSKTLMEKEALGQDNIPDYLSIVFLR